MRQIHRSIALTDRSSAGEARRAAVNVALALGFDEERRNDIGIAVTEAANNVILHANGGEILICASGVGDSAILDVSAIDLGPGIANVSRAMEDGFSTIGTPGQGLGAIGRLSDASSLYSLPEKGTIYWCRFMLQKTIPAPPAAVISVPVKGEAVSGDSYFVLPGELRSIYMVVDGLGHGVGACEAAEEALSIVIASKHECAKEIVARSHDALKKTRGAAMSVAIIHHDQKTLQYAGVGNVGATLVSGTSSRSLVSQNGTLGAVLPRLQEYSYPIESNSLLIMFSDGLASKAGLSGYAGLQGRPPALIAAVLYRDFSRRRDDATVLVARIEERRG